MSTLLLPPEGSTNYGQQGDETYGQGTTTTLPASATTTVTGSGSTRTINVQYSSGRSDQITARLDAAGDLVLVNDQITTTYQSFRLVTDFNPDSPVTLLPAGSTAQNGSFGGNTTGSWTTSPSMGSGCRTGNLSVTFTSGDLTGTYMVDTCWAPDGRLASQTLKADVAKDGIRYQQHATLR